MALEKLPIFVDFQLPNNVEYNVVQEQSITEINSNSNQQNTVRNLQDVDTEASEVYFLCEDTLEDKHTLKTDYQPTVVQSCKEKDSEPNSLEDISRDEIVKNSVDQNTSKTSIAEDPHYPPTEDLNSEEENAKNEDPLRKKRLKRRYVKESNWKR
ncbi:hypothetical protein QE152_g34979 [Popillia japonica]|uniref:Uncharacterized protein n=1 Tax=Popillia japonica TaxID=7064 RepID=A0AAW1IT22_POPJA